MTFGSWSASVAMRSFYALESDAALAAHNGRAAGINMKTISAAHFLFTKINLFVKIFYIRAYSSAG